MNEHGVSSGGFMWLCKRRYMNKDVIADRYARLYELPELLAQDRAVTSVCLDYKGGAGEVSAQPGPRSRWYSWGFAKWLRRLPALVREQRPTVIIASSDCLHVIAGALLARLYSIPFFADLYDDYESLGMAKLPGVRLFYRKALKQARGIIAVSEPLAEMIQSEFPDKPVLVLESTIDKSVFFPRGHEKSRELLNLPAGPLIGAFGALNPKRDIGTLYTAFEAIRQRHPTARLVLAGTPAGIPVPRDEGVVFLGAVAHEQMPLLFSAMDVAVITMADSSFGYYAFPQKAYEMLACRIPMVVADVGALGRLFDSREHMTYAPGDRDSLVSAITGQIETPQLNTTEIPDWRGQAQRLAVFIEANA